MQYPFHIILRKKVSALLNHFFSLFRKKISHATLLDTQDIQNILIIRPNYRIGNLIFLTPLINELAKYYPHAKIDIIVGLKLAGDILEPMPNVDKVIDIPRKLLLHPFEMFAYIRETRKKNYDVALNISGASTSAQIVTSLAKAKQKASFYDKRLWANFTHIQERGEPKHPHMGLEILEFLRFFDIKVPTLAPSLDIQLTQRELQEARDDFSTLLEGKKSKVIAIFRNARFDKKIDDSWWSEWVDMLLAMHKDLLIIDILSPDIPHKLNEKVFAYSNKNLRVLGAFFHTCDLYVSADTGPMHLAVASDAKVLALFNKTNIAVYGALGIKNRTIDIEKRSIEEVVAITLEQLHS